jgi:hypothetical protein
VKNKKQSEAVEVFPKIDALFRIMFKKQNVLILNLMCGYSRALYTSVPETRPLT